MPTPFARRLSSAREEASLSQAALGQAVNAGQSTVATWERGRNEPDLATILRLAKKLHKPPEWLAFGVNVPLTDDLNLIPEIDIRAPSGPFGMIELSQGELAQMTLTRYGFPTEAFRQVFGSTPDGIVIIEVRGDSMMPTLMPGERVMVDMRDRVPSPPGLFVLYDGLGLVLKRVEYIANSEPPRLRVISDNPLHQPYERNLDEIAIQGRVIGSLMRR